MIKKLAFGLMAVGIVASTSVGQIVDGTVDAVYGDALAVQTVNTQFGDNENEWNAAYGIISGDRLYITLTGNLQTNFNKLEIFIDSTAGGQSVFDSSGNDNAERMDGLVFDTDFTADFHLIARRGSSKFDLDFANLGTQTFTFYENVFGGTDAGAGMTGTSLVNSMPILLAYDGSNMAGVVAGTDAADQDAARLVTTGFEFSIALADIGYTGGSINVMIGQNGDGHHYWSNQFLGGLEPPQGNLGGDQMGGFTGEGAIDMTDFDGNQYFTVVPEASSLSLLAGPALLGAWFFFRRRRA